MCAHFSKEQKPDDTWKVVRQEDTKLTGAPAKTQHSKTLALEGHLHSDDLLPDLLGDMFLWDQHQHHDKLKQNMRH